VGETIDAVVVRRGTVGGRSIVYLRINVSKRDGGCSRKGRVGGVELKQLQHVDIIVLAGTFGGRNP